MKKKSHKKGMSTGAMVGTAATVAAMSAAAYLLFGPEGKKNRKAIRGWKVKMKGEIIEKFEKVKALTEPAYHAIINEVQAKYTKAKDIDQKELAGLIGDIRKHWKVISKVSKPNIKKTVRKVKSVVKKAKKVASSK